MSLAPAAAFARAHHAKPVLVAILGCGVLALCIARVPLPQAGTDFGSYTHAVGFFLAPLLPVPAVGLALSGAEPYERQAWRSLAGLRFLWCLVIVVAVHAVLLPSALSHPVADAERVLVENATAILGLTFLLRCWLSPRWVWLPVFVVAMSGVQGPDYGWAAKIAFVDRTSSGGDLVFGAAMVLLGALTFAIRGPSRPR